METENELEGEGQEIQSLEDTIAATLDAMGSDATGEGEAGAGSGGENGSQGSDAASQPPTTPQEKDDDAAAAAATPPSDEAAQEAASSSLLEAPKSWRKEVAAEFQKLPASVQAEIHRRETDFHNGLNQYREAASFAREVDTVLQPFMHTINGFNATPQQAIQVLFNADHILRYGGEEGKVRGLQAIMRDYNISPDMVARAVQDVAAAPQLDPAVQSVMQKVQTIESTLARERQAVAEQQALTLQDQITEFAADASNKYFAAVRPIMAQLFEAGQASTLREAYDKAVWLDPATRTALLEEQRLEAVSKVEAAREEKLKSLRHKQKQGRAVVIPGASVKAPKAPTTLENTIGEAYDSLVAGN